MINNIDEYLSFTYSDEESKISPKVHFEKEQFEIFLPTKYKSEPQKSGEGLLNWITERYSEFFVYFHGPFSEYKITLGLRFLDYHYQKYIDKYGNGLDFLIYIQENIDILTDGKEARKKIFLDWIEEKKKESNYSNQPFQVNIKKDKRYKLPQQLLLMKRTGIIKYLDRYNLNAGKKALLISRIIGSDLKNTTDYLRTIELKGHGKNCNTEKNNDLIDQLFSELGIIETL